MHRTLAPLAALCLSLVLTAGQDPGAPAVVRKPDTTLGDFDWIAGRWQRGGGSELLEEQWNEPIGNCMTGSFRWLKKGVGWVYEFLLIEQTDEGIAFYLRHFGEGSRAHEAPDAPLDYALKSVRDGEAIFEHPTRKDMKRMIYRRPDDDTLVVRVEGERPDGRVSAMEFRFTRASDAAVAARATSQPSASDR